ncbi:MAG: S8 family serine peptidase, partial [Nanoarchaeota archaeon]|nr:S8 family serine peptidase [Nanoarchaeota archaeon]
SSKVESKLKHLSSTEYFLLQFYSPLEKEELNVLESRGIRPLEYVGGNAYIVSLLPSSSSLFLESSTTNYSNLEYNPLLNDVLKTTKVRAVSEINKDLKTTKNVLERTFEAYNLDKNGNVILIVKYYSDVKQSLISELETLGSSIYSQVDIVNWLILSIPLENISQLLEISGIAFVQENYPFPQSENLITSKNLSMILPLQTSPYNLNGNGIKIFQYETGIPDKNHPDLGGRVSWTVSNTSYITDHATHVAGILVGNGSLSSQIGVAPEATIWADVLENSTYNLTADIVLDYVVGIDTKASKLISNSWGFLIKDKLDSSSDNESLCRRYGDYELVASFLDEVVSGENFSYGSVPIVFSAGNEREEYSNNPCGIYNLAYPYHTINTPKAAKNILAVGSLDFDKSIFPTSSFGPVDDGRIKPELVASGCANATSANNSYAFKCGTSMAAPHVSGTIALMLEQWNKSGHDEDPLPSTIKALLLDSTTDLNRTGNGDQVIDGPDYVNGYGLLNAKGAVDRIINGTFLEANISDISDVDVYAINISAQSSLKVTLA